ncbi:MAG: hypothetical protein P8175_19305 [Deltaproteobacteria bacterium]
MIGIAIGSDQKQVGVYRKQLSVPFPVFVDPKRDVYDALGRTGTPFFIIMASNGKVLTTHRGPIRDPDEILAQIKQALAKQQSQ